MTTAQTTRNEDADTVGKWLRVKASFLFFLTFVTFPDAHRGIIRYELWPDLYEFIKDLLSEKLIIVVKARQVGATLIVAIYLLWKALTQEGFNGLIISKSETASSRVLNRIKRIWSLLPPWLKAEHDKWSETEISFPAMKSSILALPSSENPAQGETASVAVLDEYHYHRWPEEDYQSVEPTTQHGQLIVISTFQKKKPNDKFATLVRDAQQDLNGFKLRFLSVFSNPYRGKRFMELVEKKYKGDEDGRKAAYPYTIEEAISATSKESVFPSVILDRSCDGLVKWNEERGIIFSSIGYLADLAYGAGADVSQGTGSDSQAMVLIGRRALKAEVVGVIHNNKLSVPDFSVEIIEFLNRYRNPLLGIEANGIGHYLISEMVKQKYTKIFRRMQNGVLGPYGWYTAGNSALMNKDRMLIELAHAIATGELDVSFKPLADQLKSVYRIQDKGGLVHIKATSRYDDLIMACAIAWQMLKQVHNTSYANNEPTTYIEEKSLGGMYA